MRSSSSSLRDSLRNKKNIEIGRVSADNYYSTNSRPLTGSSSNKNTSSYNYEKRGVSADPSNREKYSSNSRYISSSKFSNNLDYYSNSNSNTNSGAQSLIYQQVEGRPVSSSPSHSNVQQKSYLK